MKLIAHRGASDEAPENTIAALRAAWEAHADGAEVDIRLTRDGRIVLFHDAVTKRTAGHEGLISELTWSEARRLDAGSWKSPSWKGQRIPLLSEAIEAMPEGKKLFVEIKCGAEMFQPLGGELSKFKDRAPDLVLLGFDFSIMCSAKRNFALHAVYLNIEPDDLLDASGWIERARDAGLDGLSLGMGANVTAMNVARIKQAGLGTAVWTIDDEDVARTLQGYELDYLMTNHPRRLRSVVQ